MGDRFSGAVSLLVSSGIRVGSVTVDVEKVDINSFLWIAYSYMTDTCVLLLFPSFLVDTFGLN